jgi:transposase
VFESKRRSLNVSSLIVNKRSHQKKSYCQRKLTPRLRQHEREQAVGMLLAGMAQTQIANHFNVSRMTIYRLMIRLRDTGTTSDRPCSERPRVMTLRQDRHIWYINLRNRFVTAVHTARLTPGRTNVRIPDQTVVNRLRQCGLRARRPLKGSTLKQRHRAAWLQWGRTRLRRNRNTWQSILFSDESRFCLKFTVVAENASLTLVYWKLTVLAWNKPSRTNWFKSYWR